MKRFKLGDQVAIVMPKKDKQTGKTICFRVGEGEIAHVGFFKVVVRLLVTETPSRVDKYGVPMDKEREIYVTKYKWNVNRLTKQKQGDCRDYMVGEMDGIYFSSPMSRLEDYKYTTDYDLCRVIAENLTKKEAGILTKFIINETDMVAELVRKECEALKEDYQEENEDKK